MSLIITSIGLNKLANASDINPLVIKDFALGDGNGTAISPKPTTTSLVNEILRLPVNSVSSVDNKVTIKCVLSLGTEITNAFTAREIGVFDNDGELVAIGNIADEYIPASSEDIATENIYTLLFTYENGEVNIVVEVNPSIYALQSDHEELKARVATLENNQLALGNNLIGFLEWENKDQTYKDQLIVEKGPLTWVLLDETNILNIADYPILYANLNAEEIKDSNGVGTGTFKPRALKDGTIRHLVTGNTGRLLGTYQEDAFQGHIHNWTGPTNTWSIAGAGGITWTSGASQGVANFRVTGAINDGNNGTPRIASETRMKNTSVQKYVLAKIQY